MIFVIQSSRHDRSRTSPDHRSVGGDRVGGREGVRSRDGHGQDETGFRHLTVAKINNCYFGYKYELGLHLSRPART